jgi:hypothetical protein
MKTLFLLLLFVSCAHQTLKDEVPQWVSAIRNGEQTLKFPQGSKTYYRRIAGGKEISKQTSCELAVIKAEEDIKKEYPLMPVVPYSVEVLFFDEEFKDCAVTLSINSDLSKQYADLKLKHENSLIHRQELLAKDNVTADEAAEIVIIRSELAKEDALTGLTKLEFEKFTKDVVVMNEGANLCSPVFNTNSFSIHGTTHICWLGNTIKGYCTVRDSVCWNRTP